VVDPDRLKLYRYVTAPEAADYLAIMDRFTDALFAEWSAQDVIAHGVDLPVDTVVARCRYLADNGNLLLSPREVRVTTIAEYQSQPARYTVSALGARLHREVTAFLAVTGGAREVPRELLALVAEGLARLDPGGEPESLAGAVSTIFGQFHEFAASVTDFYTYIGSVLTRSDLDGEEWAGFKGLLLDYLESIVESVRRHGHAISDCLALLRPELPRLLDRISESDGAFAALQAASPGGEDVERARGRTRVDWDQLEAWFIGPGARQLRDAAHRAVGAMLTSLKRINASATNEVSLRRHYLKLATWFDAAAPLDAHALAAAAFGLYGVRHLGVVLDEDIAEAVPATMSWWRAPRAPVPVSQRERGDRAARGSASRPPDHTSQKRLLLAARAAEAQRRESACSELLAVGGHLAEARLSGGAMSVLLELLSNATSDGQATLPDHDVRLRVTASPESMQITSDLGDLVVEKRALVIGPASAASAADADADADEHHDARQGAM
jgi:uncharacterized protein (TIGR02677 family)